MASISKSTNTPLSGELSSLKSQIAKDKNGKAMDPSKACAIIAKKVSEKAWKFFEDNFPLVRTLKQPQNQNATPEITKSPIQKDRLVTLGPDPSDRLITFVFAFNTEISLQLLERYKVPSDASIDEKYEMVLKQNKMIDELVIQQFRFAQIIPGMDIFGKNEVNDFVLCYHFAFQEESWGSPLSSACILELAEAKVENLQKFLQSKDYELTQNPQKGDLIVYVNQGIAAHYGRIDEVGDCLENTMVLSKFGSAAVCRHRAGLTPYFLKDVLFFSKRTDDK